VVLRDQGNRKKSRQANYKQCYFHPPSILFPAKREKPSDTTNLIEKTTNIWYILSGRYENGAEKKIFAMALLLVANASLYAERLPGWMIHLRDVIFEQSLSAKK